METTNVLKIDSFSMVPNTESRNWIGFNAVLDSKLVFFAENGSPSATIVITTKAENVTSEGEGLRKVFQNFLNGFSEFDFQYHMNLEKTEAVLKWNKIDKLEVNMPEPLRSEIERIFDVSNWTFPLKTIVQ